MCLFRLWTNDAPPSLGEMLLDWGTLLGFGTSFLVAGRAYWNGRILRGLIATGVGGLIVVVILLVVWG